MLDIDYWEPHASGIMAWALKALPRISKLKRFSQPKISQDLREELALENNPTKEYILEKLRPVDKGKISINWVYNDYVETMRGNNNFPKSKIMFGKELQSAIPNLTKNEVDWKNGKAIKYYRGVLFINDSVCIENPDIKR